MAKERTSVRMQAQIKLMSEQGYSIRRVSQGQVFTFDIDIFTDSGIGGN